MSQICVGISIDSEWQFPRNYDKCLREELYTK